MKISYSNGQINDLDEIFELFQAAIVEMDRNEIPQWDHIYPNRGVLERDILQNELYVGRIEDRIAVVYVINMEADEQYNNASWSYDKDNYCILHRVCVHPKFQNLGIGAKTLDQIHKQVKEEQMGSIRLDAFSLNPYALKMYEKAGYQTVGTADFRKGMFYLMEKVLED